MCNNYPFNSQCQEYAKQFDSAFDSCDWQQTKHLIKECEQILEKNDTFEYAPLHYYIGTSYSDLVSHDNAIKQNPDEVLRLKKLSLFHYRKAAEYLQQDNVLNGEETPWRDALALNVFTNYANALFFCGRLVAACNYYRQALSLQPSFRMANGNMGATLQRYSSLLHDNGQANALNYYSLHHLQKAASESTSDPIQKEAQTYFAECLNRFDPDYVRLLIKEPPLKDFDLGDSEEKSYRLWCMKQHLFLTPLNDLAVIHSAIAADTLQLPPIVTPVTQNDIPVYFGIFNQIKQEYIYARYLLYGYQAKDGIVHYADKETYLVNLYDFPQYSIRIEEVKTAFRSLYSLFDKVAFFINEYWNLGIKPRDVSFTQIWKDKKRTREGEYSHKSLKALTDTNWMINSIYWIYKDFSEKFGDSGSPEAEIINTVRNALEHRYVKVHSSLFTEVKTPYFDDTNTFHISEEQLFHFAMDLISLVRELIIYLIISVYIEEYQRKNVNDDNSIVQSITLRPFNDEWKT